MQQLLALNLPAPADQHLHLALQAYVGAFDRGHDRRAGDHLAVVLGARAALNLDVLGRQRCRPSTVPAPPAIPSIPVFTEIATIRP